MTRSLWRREARAAIALALETLPGVASEKECRAVLKAAYPFGPREMHPYRCWRAEVKRAINTRFCLPKALAEVFCTPAEVICEACLKIGNPTTNGCFLCMFHRRWLADLPVRMREEWASLVAEGGPVAGDWVEEHGAGLAGLAGGRA